ncbi:MAG: hypothetical protein MUC63_11150 [Planctomycetes bacterium]|nr:hypothetical protein [Planctomycetota bacterium]
MPHISSPNARPHTDSGSASSSTRADLIASRSVFKASPSGVRRRRISWKRARPSGIWARKASRDTESDRKPPPAPLPAAISSSRSRSAFRSIPGIPDSSRTSARSRFSPSFPAGSSADPPSRKASMRNTGSSGSGTAITRIPLGSVERKGAGEGTSNGGSLAGRSFGDAGPGSAGDGSGPSPPPGTVSPSGSGASSS